MSARIVLAKFSDVITTRSVRKRVWVAVGLGLPVGAGVEDDVGEVELLFKLQAPLLAEAGGADDEQPPFAFGPILAQHQPGLDGLAEPDLIGQQHALRQRIAKGEGGGVDLVRVQVHAGVEQRHRQTIPATRPMLPGELVSEVSGVVRGGHIAFIPALSPAFGPVGCTGAILSRQVIIISVRFTGTQVGPLVLAAVSIFG